MQDTQGERSERRRKAWILLGLAVVLAIPLLAFGAIRWSRAETPTALPFTSSSPASSPDTSGQGSASELQGVVGDSENGDDGKVQDSEARDVTPTSIASAVAGQTATSTQSGITATTTATAATRSGPSVPTTQPKRTTTTTQPEIPPAETQPPLSTASAPAPAPATPAPVTPGSFLLSIGSIQLLEEAGTQVVTVTLAQQPQSNVVVALETSSTANATVDIAQVTLTPSNWQAGQAFTVTAIDDADYRTDTATITASVVAASSSDEFDAAGPKTVAVSFDDTVDRVDHAVRTADISLASRAEVEAHAANEVATILQECEAVIEAIYPGGSFPVATYPSKRIQKVNSVSLANIPIHVTGNQVHSWVGATAEGARYAYLGTNVFAFNNVNGSSNLVVELKDSTVNTLAYILDRDPDTMFDEALVIYADRDGTAVHINNWLATNNIVNNWTVTGAPATLGSYDLFVGQQYDNALFEQSMNQGIATLYYNNWYDPRDAVGVTSTGELMGVRPRFSGSTQTPRYGSSAADHCRQNFMPAAGLETMLTTVTTRDYGFAYDSTVCPDGAGFRVWCNGDLVVDGTGRTLNDKYLTSANQLRSTLATLEGEAVDLYRPANFEGDILFKSLVLYGDHLRQSSVYPLSIDLVSQERFYEGHFASVSAITIRPPVPLDNDLGDFSDDAAALANAPRSTQSLTYAPTEFSEWTATGMYVVPSQPATITRTDSSTEDVVISVNFQRDPNLVKLWDGGQFRRPMYVNVSNIPLGPGETVTLNHFAGGPVYMHTVGGSADVSLNFDNVGSHPFLTSTTAADIAAFSADLATTPYNWIDIKSEFAEIHSRKDHVITALNEVDGDSSNGYTEADVQQHIFEIDTYLVTGNYAYAGFTGPGVSALNANVQAYCTAMTIDCTDPVVHAAPKRQHINTDTNARCGSLCSGNPFDSNKRVRPVAWEENHEMGHNLQRDRLKIYGGAKSQEVSTDIFPSYQVRQYAIDNGRTSTGNEKIPHERTYGILKTEIAASTPAGTGHGLWTRGSTRERASFYIQLIHSADSDWDLYTKMYLLERIFTEAVGDDASWLAQRDVLGFSSFSRDDAIVITAEDFMAIAASDMYGKNYTQYFEAFGVAVSPAAEAQIVTNGTPNGETELIYFYIPDDELTVDINTTAPYRIPLDGIADWGLQP